MVVFPSGTKPVDEISPSLDGTLSSSLLKIHQQNCQAKYFSKYTLNLRKIPGGEM